ASPAPAAHTTPPARPASTGRPPCPAVRTWAFTSTNGKRGSLPGGPLSRDDLRITALFVAGVPLGEVGVDPHAVGDDSRDVNSALPAAGLAAFPPVRLGLGIGRLVRRGDLVCVHGSASACAARKGRETIPIARSASLLDWRAMRMPASSSVVRPRRKLPERRELRRASKNLFTTKDAKDTKQGR